MGINETLLVTPSEMGRIDLTAIEAGIDSYVLMRAAGAHVAAVLLAHYPQTRRAIVLCGPGNNGGDGHVAARALLESGVEVIRYGVKPKPGGDAARAFADCPGQVFPLGDWLPQPGDVVIDALFGAGLDRPVDTDIAGAIERARQARVPAIAVDLPSGLSGLTGMPTGPCFSAEHTVTFAALKPGHLLMPGRALCGQVHLCDIGIPGRIIVSDDPIWKNNPDLYTACLPSQHPAQHKYSRGHLAVFSGPLISGSAARMAAEAGLRAGAGLVTLATPPGAVMAQAAHLTAVMQSAIANADDVEAWVADPRLSAFVAGPGFGDPARLADYVAVLAGSGRPLVLDADGLSAFEVDRNALGDLFSGATRLVITPHEGEFRRLFPELAEDAALSKVDRARRAANALNAIVVYKGPDTVIAGPEGRCAINADAPAWLATAGSGDVLSGIIGALLAQGMPPFEAACAGVALHGEAGTRAGGGMTAEDLIRAVRPPQV